jgi:tetratricopeptide (TPR) repeat protein
MDILALKQLAADAQAEYKNGKYESAAQLFKAAADGYSANGDALAAAEMANDCSVAYLKAGNAKDALETCVGTEAIFAENGDVKHQAMAIGNQAAAMEKLNRRDDAIREYYKSAELLKSVGEDELCAYVYKSISAIQLRKMKYLDAYASMRAGVMGVQKPNLSQKLLKKLIDIPFKLFR